MQQSEKRKGLNRMIIIGKGNDGGQVEVNQCIGFSR